MKKSVKEIWIQIEEWLGANAPKVLDDIYPGVSEEDIQTLQTQIGMVLPNDFKESLLTHNGNDGYYSIVSPWSLFKDIYISREVLDMGKEFCNGKEEDELEARGPVKPMLWNTAWIPFAGDGAGNLLCLDLDPQPEGTIGQVIVWACDPPYVEVIAKDFRTWLTQFADDLQAGKFKFEYNAEYKFEDWMRNEE